MTTQFVVRLAPITSQPILVHADSLKDGQLTAIIGEESKVIGVDWFRASAPVDPEIAHKIVQEYAKKHGMDEHSILVRSRLPKTNVKPRKTNDANLVLVQNKQDEQPKKEEARQETRRKDDLTNMAQAMQDAHDKQKKGEQKSSEGSTATANNPQGATVKRTVEEKKPAKRAYQKRDKERSARSKAAYERYVKEIGQQVADSPTAMTPAVPGPGVTSAQVDEATLKLAQALAEILMKHKVL